MNKKDIFKKIIMDRPEGIGLTPRELKLPVDTGKVISLYGPRRCGKTYLFYQTMRELEDKNIPSERILYVNFEDERILPFRREDWELLLEAYFELYPENVNKKNYLFLDEIQEAPLWEKFVRRVSEKKNFEIFLTGSSSKLFSREISTALRGRTLGFFLTPFSFREFAEFKDIEAARNIEHSPLRHKVKSLFQEYMKFGGFPEIFDKDEPFKTEILQGYFELIFYKDIVERHGIRNFTLMKDLMRYLIAHFATAFSLTGYYNFLKSSGQKIGKDTLFTYLSCLEEVNFVRLVRRFDFSLKKQTVNPKKAYCIDTGLVTAVSFQFSENRGRYIENLAFLELLRRRKEIYYYRDSKENEVDFLITEKGRPRELIQACAYLKKGETREREVGALLGAAKQFKIKKCLILTEDQKDDFIEDGLKIRVLPLWQWLLGSS
jgi:uncharacterized protein